MAWEHGMLKTGTNTYYNTILFSSVNIETELTMSVSKIVNLMKSYTTYHIWEKISELFAKAFLERTYLLDRWLFCM